MAREIVITSVPRGVKLGRTGFQVAMQTAGLRDDLAAQLEKMAGYRHLPTGVPNPVCYFHRVTKTFAGPVSVLGRIVDAGVDFSNRSNKLAHMVVLEAADVGQVASSTPAAVLAAVEGRLATTWPGPAEERREPFSIAGVQASQPARCGLWQQVMGDAGWAGVLAERAVRGQATLIIGRDSSPESCRRMLALFQEALAIVPPAKRWGVTFDTATLAPEGVLWRGTYAGSPESQTAQPGVLVIDLARPQPIPQNLEAGELVTIAREGPPRPVMPKPGAAGIGSQAPPAPGGSQPSSSAAEFGRAASGGRPPQYAVSGPGGAPPPAPIPGADWPGAPSGGEGQRGPSHRGLIWGLAACCALILLAIIGAGAYLVVPRVLQGQALDRFHRFASKHDGKSVAPTAADLRRATGMTSDELKDDEAKAAVAFLNDWLPSDEATDARALAVSKAEELRKVLVSVRTVMNPSSAGNGLSGAIGSLCPRADQSDREVVAARHTKGFQTWHELSETLRQASDRRVARSSALKSIQAYARDPGKNDPPTLELYCLALDIADQSTVLASSVEFLNCFLKSGEPKASAVETQGKLAELLRETKATLSVTPPKQGRGLYHLTDGRDASFSKLLDDLHPAPFQDYETFASFVSQLSSFVELSNLTDEKDRVTKSVGEDLWKAMWGDDASFKVRLGEDRKGQKFAQQVQPADLESLGSLRAALDRVYPRREGDGVGRRSEPVEVLGGDLQKSIAKFRNDIETGRVNCRETLEQGGSVALFPLLPNVAVKVAARSDLKTNIVGISGGAHLTISDDEVLILRQGENWTVEKGKDWAKHKDAAMFLPIGFARDVNAPVEAGDWIVLSPPVVTRLPSQEPTLHDLLFGLKPVSVTLPVGVSVASLRLSTQSIKDPDGPLTVEIKAGESGNSAALVITASIDTATTIDKTEEVKYSLTERVSISEDQVQLVSPTGWNDSPLRLKALMRQSGSDVDKEHTFVGFGPRRGRGEGDAALRDVTPDMLKAVTQAIASKWSDPKQPRGETERHLSRWGDREKLPSTLPGLRDHLRDWLAKQKNGFATQCRMEYEKRHQRPPDPGEFAEPTQGDKEDDEKFKARKRDRLREHSNQKQALETHEQDVRTYVDGEVRDPESLRRYVESKCDPRKTKEIDPEVAAACFLLEIDGLIVAKVFRQELEALLQRVPVGAFVEGSVEPRGWESWVANGSSIAMVDSVRVPERTLRPAKDLIQSAEQPPTQGGASAAAGVSGDAAPEAGTELGGKPSR
jgi:hypothetical protein